MGVKEYPNVKVPLPETVKTGDARMVLVTGADPKPVKARTPVKFVAAPSASFRARMVTWNGTLGHCGEGIVSQVKCVATAGSTQQV